MGNTISYKKEFGLIVVGSIIFTASFMWKDLLTDIEEHYFPKYSGLTGRLLYVTVVTIILVILAIHLRYLLGLSNTQIKVDDEPIDHNHTGIMDHTDMPDNGDSG